MKFKVLCLTLLLSVCCVVSFLSFTGCDEDDDPTAPKATKTPTAPPGPTATPSPTPMTNDTFISGRAIVNVTGATIAPDDEHDKGTIFSVDGLYCEVVWVRLRNRDNAAYFQLKGTSDNQAADDCWGEWNYWSMVKADDGDWVMTWETTGNWTRVRVEAPNGNSEEITIPNYLGLNHISTATTNCIRPPVPGSTTAVAVSFEGYTPGSTTGCPY
jgi:hypothetical protein